MASYITETFTFLRYNVPSSFWLSDAEGLVDPWQMVLPIWLPRKVFITRARVMCSNRAASGQLNLSIDPESIAYNTGAPTWHQEGADVRRNLMLANTWIDLNNDATFDHNPPKLLDRDRGDRLWWQCDWAGVQQYAAIQLDYLVETSNAPNKPLKASKGWNARVNILDSMSVIMTPQVGWAGYTFAVSIDPIRIEGSAGSKTRVVFQGNGCTLSDLWIGPRNGGVFSADPALWTQLTFGGNTTTSVNGKKTSDTIDLGFDGSGGLMVSGFINSDTAVIGSVGVGNLGGHSAGWQTCWKLGNDAASPAKVGYNSGGTPTVALTEIHAFYDNDEEM